MSAPQATEQLVAPPSTGTGRMHRPVRAVVALAELLAAGAAVWAAFWAWPRGFSTITTVIAEGTVLESQRIYGNWLAAAIGFGTVAALLVLDAVRQVLLAVRARPRRARKDKASGGDPGAAPAARPEANSDAAADASEAVSDARVSGDD